MIDLSKISFSNRSIREKTLRMIRKLKAKQVSINSIGIQGHHHLDRIPWKEIEDSILAYHAECPSVMITELDNDVAFRTNDTADVNQTEIKSTDRFANGLPEDMQKRLADQYAARFTLFFKHRDKVKRVTFSGLHDGLSWLNHFPSERTNHPLLWDRNLNPKPAFFSVLETARRGSLNAVTP